MRHMEKRAEQVRARLNSAKAVNTRLREKINAKRRHRGGVFTPALRTHDTAARHSHGVAHCVSPRLHPSSRAVAHVPSLVLLVRPVSFQEILAKLERKFEAKREEMARLVEESTSANRALDRTATALQVGWWIVSFEPAPQEARHRRNAHSRWATPDGCWRCAVVCAWQQRVEQATIREKQEFSSEWTKLGDVRLS